MACEKARRFRTFTEKNSKNFYKDLDNFSTAIFLENRKRKVKNVDGGSFFEVDRLIAMRETRNKELEYLVKWKGYSAYDSTWEPEQNVTSNYFNEPNPEKNIIVGDVGRLRVALEQSLKCPRTRQRLTFEFREDVFCYLFKGKGEKDGTWQVLERGDFSHHFFPDQWDCLLDPHGQGTKVHFPLKVRHFISWSPNGHIVDARSGNVMPSPRAFQEKMSMDFIKVAA